MSLSGNVNDSILFLLRFSVCFLVDLWGMMYLCSMKMHDNDTSASGYLTNAFEGISLTFTDIEVLSISEVNVVAKAKRYGRWWLLKGLRKEVAMQSGYQQRLRKELEILMLLQHPHVVATYGMEDVEGLGRCIVMEYVDGPTLKEWLEEKPSRQLRVKVAREVIDAAAYIHAKGVVHRDLKPENIIVTPNGSNAKLIDFGLADTDSHTILKQPAGTPAYMSPEQRQTAVADVRNDIYSIGVILQQMNLGWRYWPVIKKCLQPIDKRYQNVQDLQHHFLSKDGSIKKIVALMGALMVVTLLFLIGLQMWRAKEQDERLTNLNATYQQEQKVQQQKMAQLADTIAELRAYNQQVREREAGIEANRKRVKEAIDKGRAIIERTMRQTKIDQHLDTLSDLIYIWNDYTKRCQSGYRATEVYLEQIRPSFDDAEMAEITKTLNQHCTDIIEKWNRKVVILSR